MGGFHLSDAVFEPIIEETIAEFKKIEPEVIVPMHCTGWNLIEGFSQEFPSSFTLNSAGTRILLYTGFLCIMKYLIYLLLILYALSPFDLLSEFFAGPIGVIEDVITIGLLYWCFVYRPARIRAQTQRAYYREGEGGTHESYQENQQRAQPDRRLSKSDPYEVLGVDKEAYQELVNR